MLYQHPSTLLAGLLAVLGALGPAYAGPISTYPSPYADAPPVVEFSGRTSVPVAPRRRTVRSIHPTYELAKAQLKHSGNYSAKVARFLERYPTSERKKARDAAIDRRQAGAGAGGTGSVANYPVQGEIEYMTSVDIGTPAQNLPLNFDTGSSDLWVFGTGLPSAQTMGQLLYDHSASSTAAKLDGATWGISYGDGSSSSGEVYTDTVTIAGLTVAKQAVEVATEVSSAFSSDPDSSGLVGLGFSSMNRVSPNSQKTWFDNIKAQLEAPLFTADLRHGANGSYNFGFIDTTVYTGDVFYAAVDDSAGYWQFTAAGYAIGTASAAAASSSSSPSPSSPSSPSLPSSPSSSPSSSTASTTAAAATTKADPNADGSNTKTQIAAQAEQTPGRTGGSVNLGGASVSECDMIAHALGGRDASAKTAATKKTLTREKGHVGVTVADMADKVAAAVVPLTNTPITAIADTGTTLLLLSDDIVSAYYAQVTGSSDGDDGAWTFPCNAALPDFVFGIAGSGSGSGSSSSSTDDAASSGTGQITIPGDYINYQALGDGTCYGGLQSSESVGINIFGDVALKAAMVVFDSNGPRLGWAQKKL